MKWMATFFLSRSFFIEGTSFQHYKECFTPRVKVGMMILSGRESLAGGYRGLFSMDSEPGPKLEVIPSGDIGPAFVRD